MNSSSTIPPPPRNEYRMILIGIEFFNIILHSCGLFILCSLKRSMQRDVHRIYLINLSVTELAKNCSLVLNVMVMCFHVEIMETINQIYYGIILNYLVMSSYYLTLLYITTDRYLVMKCRNVYKLRWNVSKARYLVMFTWFFAQLISLLVTCLHVGDVDFAKKLVVSNGEPVIVLYGRSSIDILFVLMAIFVYTSIFRQYRQSQRRVSTARHDHRYYVIFHHSRFIITFLLVTSFRPCSHYTGQLFMST